MSKSNKNMRNYVSKLRKIGGAHFQNVRNQYAKFAFKGMKTAGVTDDTM